MPAGLETQPMPFMNEHGEAVCALRRWYCAGTASSAAASAEVELFESATALDGRWRQLTERHGVFFDPVCLRVFESTGPEEAVWRYVILSFEGVPSAALVTQLVRVSDAQLSVEQDRATGLIHAAKRVRNAALGAMGRRVLVLGNLFAAGPYGVALAPGAAPARIWAAVPAVVERLRRGDARVPSADFVLVKDFETDAPGADLSLAAHGYGLLHTEPTMALALSPQWRSLADCLEQMRFKYRKAARLTIARCEADGCVIRELTANEMRVHADQIYDLYRQVESRADTRFGVLQHSHLPELARVLGPARLRCSGIFLDGVLAGFSTLLKEDSETGVAHVVGFDYAKNSRVPLYHRLLLALVEDAIAMQCGRLHFGRTALEPKARLGAIPRPAHVYVRHRNPLLNGIARVLLNSVPQRRAQARRVFRETHGD